MNLYDIPSNGIGTFDIVLFLGVLYHLKEPYTALEILYDITEDLLIVETHMDALDYNKPAMVIYQGGNADPSNWWFPNPSAVITMLKTVGFSEVREVGRWVTIGGTRGAFHARK